MAPADPFGALCRDDAVNVAGAPGGSLSGLRFAVKDLFDVAGRVTGGGNPDWRRTHAPAAANAWAVQALLDAGAHLVGCTISDELAFSLDGENAHYGTPVNPACPGRLPGGSSSGSAVAVAGSLVDFALGTDTGGSVRVPASFCGVFGIRPTHGRVPLAGVVPFAPSYDTVGWFARDAGTLQRIGGVLLRADGPRQPLSRHLLARDLFELGDPPVRDVLLQVAGRLLAPEPVDVAEGRSDDWLDAYRVLQGADIRGVLGPWIAATRPTFGTNIAPRFGSIDAITDREIVRSRTIRRQVRDRLSGLLGGDGVLVLPSAPCIAPEAPLRPEVAAAFYPRALSLCCLAGHAGLPQVSLPVAQVDGCPVGLSLLAGPGGDEALLDLAVRLTSS